MNFNSIAVGLARLWLVGVLRQGKFFSRGDTRDLLSGVPFKRELTRYTCTERTASPLAQESWV